MKNINLKALYDKYNLMYFNNELPKNIKVEWSNRMTRDAGLYSWKYQKGIKTERIALSVPYHKKYPEDIERTLIHEMIHAKYPKVHHGKQFMNEMGRLNREFNLGITRYSKEAATVNYIYTCNDCGQEYERTNRIGNFWLCKCGVCGGKLTERGLNKK